MSMAGTWNRNNIRQPLQNPGDREPRWGTFLGCGMLLQLVDQCKVSAQIVALKPRHVAPRIARAQRRDIGDIASQKTATERAIGDKADVEFLAERQDLGLDITGPQ